VLIAAQEIPAELRLYCLGVSRTRFVIAFLIIMLGRLVLTIEGSGTFLMDLSRLLQRRLRLISVEGED